MNHVGVRWRAGCGWVEQAVDFGHLGGGERAELHGSGVLLHLTASLESGDRDGSLAAGPDPAKRALDEGSPAADQNLVDVGQRIQELWAPAGGR